MTGPATAVAFLVVAVLVSVWFGMDREPRR